MAGMLTFFDCDEVEAWLANTEKANPTIAWKDYRPIELEYSGVRFREGADIFNAIQINEPFRANTGTVISEGSSGDYLCKGDGNVLFVLDKESFEGTFCLL